MLLRTAMRHRPGITMIETLVCIGIIMIVAAIVVPVTVNARHNARIASALLRLKQLHVALKLYQMENGGEGVYGTCYDMNLPDVEQLSRGYLGGSAETWVSPCEPGHKGFSYTYYSGSDPFHAGYARTYQDESMILTDLSCDPKRGLVWGDYVKTRGLGVRLGGQVVNYYKNGAPGPYPWWHPGDLRTWR